MRRFFKVLLIGLAPAGLIGTLTTPASAAAPQNELVTVVFDATSTGPGAVTATGPISGTGFDVQASRRSSGFMSHDIDVLVFDNGTVSVKDGGREVDTPDPQACTVTVSEAGNYVLTGGTGAYEGVQGHGLFTASGVIQFAGTPGNCDFNHAPTSGTVTVTAPGVVKL